MRFARRLAKRTPPELELRTVETADALHGVLAPRGWTTARVEAWLDWAESATVDAGPPTRDGLLAGGPERFADASICRSATAWDGLAVMSSACPRSSFSMVTMSRVE